MAGTNNEEAVMTDDKKKVEYKGLRGFGVEQRAEGEDPLYVDFNAPGTTDGTPDGFITIRGPAVGMVFFLNLLDALPGVSRTDRNTAKATMQAVIQSGWRGEGGPPPAQTTPTAPIVEAPKPAVVQPAPKQADLPLPAAARPAAPPPVVVHPTLPELYANAKASGAATVVAITHHINEARRGNPTLVDKALVDIEQYVLLTAVNDGTVQSNAAPEEAKPVTSEGDHNADEADPFPPDALMDAAVGVGEAVAFCVANVDFDSDTDVLVSKMQGWAEYDVPCLMGKTPDLIRQEVYESLVTQNVMTWDDLPEDLKAPPPEENPTIMGIMTRMAPTAGTVREVVDALLKANVIMRDPDAIVRAFDEASSNGVTFKFVTGGLRPRVAHLLKNAVG